MRERFLLRVLLKDWLWPIADVRERPLVGALNCRVTDSERPEAVGCGSPNPSRLCMTLRPFFQGWH
jgi:hypothetical protein